MSVAELTQQKQSTFAAILQLANPAFVAVVVFVPIGGLIFALNSSSLIPLRFVHVITGTIWTGIDIFMGFVLGPVLGGMDPASRANIFRRLVPKMTFMMPVIAGVAGAAGFILTQRMGYPITGAKIIAALVITGLLTVQGFALLLPNEIRVFRQLLSGKPDIQLISRLGMRTAKLGGLQGIFQLGIIFVMVFMNFG